MKRLVVMLLLGCGGAAATPAPPRPTGVLVVRSPVADATLWIDEQPVGEVGRLRGGVRLGVGAHRIELRHDRYHTRYADVTIAAGQRVALDLSLAEALP